MELITAASLITAFIAGIAALLAPCCIGVMLPAYLASVFKNRVQIFLMTFIYFLGILSIYLPLGLGAASLSSFFSNNHFVLFTIGALFMIFLGFSMLAGKSVMLPIKVHPNIKKHDLGSIYLLGVFSGVATTCCAPVLAGVLALSALPGSLWLGGAYALTFTLGMVAPLFAMALLVDKSSLATKISLLRRKVSYTIFSHRTTLSISHLISGTLYLVFGIFILFFETARPDAFGSGFQLEVDLWAARITRFIAQATDFVPQFLWAAIFIIVFLGIGWKVYRQAKDKIERGNDV